jgi:tetratricopeptide (TPR) repeat protein
MNNRTSSESVGQRLVDSVAHFSWSDTVRIICGIIAVLLVAVFVVKLFRSDFLTNFSLEVVLIALAVALLFPYITSFEALGVKVELTTKVDQVTSWANATPYYILASEYEDEKDYLLAEQYYEQSLVKCPDFWPAIFGEASVYDSLAEDSGKQRDFTRAINRYLDVLKLEENDLYTLNNLAAIYLSAPDPIHNPQTSQEYADKALEIMPSFGSCLYYKAEALNYQKNFQGAAEACDDIISQKLMAHSDDLYWVFYEQVLANSNLGKGLKAEDLEMIYHLAEKNNGEDGLIRVLGLEAGRFEKADQAVIDTFIGKHSP